MALESRYKGYWLLFFLNPFFTAVYSIFTLKGNAKNILWAFVVFYGVSFTFYENEKDSSRYRDQFYQYYDSQLEIKAKNGEIYTGLIQKIAVFGGRSKRFLFLWYALVFGFFYSRNLVKPLNRIEVPVTPVLFILILSFFFAVPFWSLNGVRMWTAAHLAYYAFILLFDNKRWLGSVLMLSTVLIHFSMSFIIGVLILYVILKNYLGFKTVILLFLVSYLSELSLAQSVIELVEPYIPTLYRDKYSVYTKEVYVEAFQNAKENYSWHAKYFAKAFKYGLFLLGLNAYLMWKKGLLLSKDVLWSNVFKFGLLLCSVANLLSFIPSLVRFYSIGAIFFLSGYIVLFQRQVFKNGILLRLSSLFLIFWLIVNIRDGFDLISVNTLFGNPLTLLFEDLSQFPMIELIK